MMIMIHQGGWMGQSQEGLLCGGGDGGGGTISDLVSWDCLNGVGRAGPPQRRAAFDEFANLLVRARKD